MSTAVAEAFPSYGFPGSGKKGGGGEHEKGVLVGKKMMGDGFFIEEEEEEEEAEEVLTESSSIGAPSPSSSSIGENSSSEAGEAGDEEEVESKLKVEEPGLGCLDALEESLPIKSGLSSFYAGKSKSFTSLAEAAARDAVKELAKPENPFNKRRRILRCCSIRRVSSTSLTALPPFLPPGPEPSFNDAMINGGGGSG